MAKADDGSLLLIPVGAAFQVRYNGRNLYNPANPREAAQRRAVSFTFDPGTIVLVRSPLLGYGVEDLLVRAGESSLVLCVETDQQLMALSLEQVPEPLLRHPSALWVRTESPEQLVDFVRRKTMIGRFRRVISLALSGGAASQSALYGAFEDALRAELQRYWRNRMTSVHLGRRWLRNLFANIGNLASYAPHTGIDGATPAGMGRPVIEARSVFVAGAGEGLEAAIPWVRAAREGLLVLCADTALPTLVASGIFPDFVVVLESQWANLNDFLLTIQWSPLLIADLTSSPLPLRRGSSAGLPNRVFLSRFAEIRLLDRLHNAFPALPLLSPLGSVGVCALSFAVSSASYAVFSAGLDFSFTPGKPHARGTPSHVKMLSTATRLLPGGSNGFGDLVVAEWSPDLSGRPSATTPSLRSYAHQAREIVNSSRVPVFRLGDRGLDTGMRAVTTQSEFMDLVGESTLTSEKNAIVGPVPQTEPWATRAAAFIQNEQTLLDSSIAAVHSALNSGLDSLSEAEWHSTAATVSDCDYVWLDFPDLEPILARDRSFLKRYLAAAYDYRSHIVAPTAGAR